MIKVKPKFNLELTENVMLYRNTLIIDGLHYFYFYYMRPDLEYA